MKFNNDWKSNAKQSDKVVFEIRLGKLTLFKFSVDGSKRKFRLTLLNLTIKN